MNKTALRSSGYADDFTEQSIWVFVEHLKVISIITPTNISQCELVDILILVKNINQYYGYKFTKDSEYRSHNC